MMSSFIVSMKKPRVLSKTSNIMKLSSIGCRAHTSLVKEALMCHSFNNHALTITIRDNSVSKVMQSFQNFFRFCSIIIIVINVNSQYIKTTSQCINIGGYSKTQNVKCDIKKVHSQYHMISSIIVSLTDFNKLIILRSSTNV